MSKQIHPTAIVDSRAKIGNNVIIEAYAIIKEGVTLHDGVTIKSHAYIDGYTTIGEGTTIYPFASIGTKTQDLKFRGEKTFVVIGKHCEIREGVTINSSCMENTTVSVGDNCLIMAYCHIAHNCEVGSHVVMANAAMLAGHVTVEDYAVIGGMTPVHQHCRIGRYAMVGGFSRIAYDVPPYTLGAGSPYKLGGLNLIGLKRNRFPLQVRQDLAKAFKLTYRNNLKISDALERIEQEIPASDHLQYWIEFCRSSKRGLIGFQGMEFEEEELLEDDQLLEESLLSR